eukprot:108329_1
MSTRLEVFSCKASVYKLNEVSKEWMTHGVSGKLYLYSNQIQNEVWMKWCKEEQIIWWRLPPSQLKPKGDSALVLKASLFQNNSYTHEIVAVRFTDENIAQQFSQKHKSLFLQNEPTENKNNIQNVSIPISVEQKIYIMPLKPNNVNNIGSERWKCAVCTYTNNINDRVCCMCGLSQEASVKSNTTVNRAFNSNSWKCGLCTYMNATPSISCNTCGANRDDKNSNQQRINAEHTWICKICTLENDINATNCIACNNSRSPRQSYYNMGMSMNMINGSYYYNQQHEYTNIPFKPPLDKDGNIATTIEQFQDVAIDIVSYNNSPLRPSYILLGTLRSVAKKTLKDDLRWRTLDTTNPKVMERLINFEGVLNFLTLLGFEADAMG